MILNSKTIIQTEDRTKAANAWERIIASTKVLGIHPNEALSLWSVLAAIYHLGVASVSRTNTGKFDNSLRKENFFRFLNK